MQKTARTVIPMPLPMIGAERATPIESLPQGWQDIAGGGGNAGMNSPELYVKMAQLFHHKMHHGEVDLFTKMSGFEKFKPMFGEMFGRLADETLAFYAADFDKESYPDFAALRAGLVSHNAEPARLKVVDIAEDLFREFGYDMPASFYGVHLAPLYRDEVFEVRPLRFSEADKDNARAWDAALHAQKVFPMQMRIQSISSRHGFTWEHGCQCNHALAQIATAQEAFSYDIRPEMRSTWIQAFIWTMWYEYAFFNFLPVTKYLAD